MRIAIVAPAPSPSTRGGAERAVAGLQQAIGEHSPHDCEVVKLPVEESDLIGLLNGYRAFSELDLSRFDQVISVKYPAWIAPHHDHAVLMFHPLRGVYETYHLFGQPLWPSPRATAFADLLHLIRRRHDPAVLPEFFDRFSEAVQVHGADHPDLAFPGPLAREIVHWLDLVALAPAQMRRHFALSRTVASRPGYFPTGVRPEVVHLPSDLGPLRDGAQAHLFTVSRLEGAKRIDLLIRAMSEVPGELPLLIAGSGPDDDRLRSLAGNDPRIRFLGFVGDDALVDLYADALAVPFVPHDEDLGLITLEAMGCSTPVVTCIDSGGPTEFVADGVTGLLAEPHPVGLGRALSRLVRHPELATALGQAGKRRASAVTWPDAVRRLVGPPGVERPSPLRAGAVASPSRRDSRPSVGGGRPSGPGRRRPRIVATATYPVHPPQGGGQLRCFHLYGSLARYADVEVVCLVDPVRRAGSSEVAPGLVQTLVHLSPTHLEAGQELSNAAHVPVTDIVAGSHIWATPAYLDALRRAADGADAVLLAHPYLLPAVERAKLGLPLVYDAHNVEADLKASALPDTALGRELLATTIDVERRATLDAAAVVACSAEDAEALSALYGRRRDDVDLIPNGTDTAVAVPTPEQRRFVSQRWRERFARNGLDGRRPAHLGLFFASWHPPNLDAAEFLVQMAAELPDVLFLLAGSHGEAFRGRLTAPNVVLGGVVAEQAKAGLLRCVDVALNPMRAGSGTNLKVIEYLAAGAPAVSTAFGVRGLDVVDGEHLLIRPPDRFAEAVRATVDDPVAAHRRAAAGRLLAVERYDWRPLGDHLWSVVAGVVSGQRSPSPVDGR